MQFKNPAFMKKAEEFVKKLPIKAICLEEIDSGIAVTLNEDSGYDIYFDLKVWEPKEKEIRVVRLGVTGLGIIDCNFTNPRIKKFSEALAFAQEHLIKRNPDPS